MVDGVGLVVLDTDIGFLYADGFHQDGDADEQFLSVFEHRAVVRRKVGLALHAVDDERFGLLSGRYRQLHVRGERRTAHADDAGILDLGDDLGSRERALLDQRFGTVNAFGPLVAFALDRNHHLT